jgi:hypothetical protein
LRTDRLTLEMLMNFVLWNANYFFREIIMSRTPTRSRTNSRNPSPTTTPAISPVIRRKDSFRTPSRSSISQPTCHVAVRVRPVFEEDVGSTIWNCDRKGKIEIDKLFALEVGRKGSDSFYFDQTYEGSDNQILYEKSVKSFIKDAIVKGVSTTVFAYGQTNSGKTYSMMGFDDEPGIIPQSIDDVFNYIRESEDGKEYLLRVSYLEIYNETIRDLLNPEQKDLRIHENRHVCFF